MKLFFLSFFLSISIASFSQLNQSFTISGEVKDALTGKVLTGVSVALIDASPERTFTNANGIYSINKPAGVYKMSVSFMGYITDTTTIMVDRSQEFGIRLQSHQTQNAEVVVTDKSKTENNPLLIVDIDIQNMATKSKFPIIFCERDIVKSNRFLPGFKAENVINIGLSIQAITPDQTSLHSN